MNENQKVNDKSEEELTICELKDRLKNNLLNERGKLAKCLKYEIENIKLDSLQYEKHGEHPSVISVSKDGKTKRLEFNSKRGNANGKGLEWYRWLILEHYKNDDYVRSYCLGLCREDLDLGTGNIHQDFTKLQMSKCCFMTDEPSVNPYPSKNKQECFYTLNYYANNCFPIALRKSQVKDSNNKFKNVKKDSEPWGHSDFKCEYGSKKEIITAKDMSEKIMDRTNDDYYDAKKVASFFLQLCAYDAGMCEN